ncbi:MAG TPA: lysophospholipid acyltransferase family protein [Candidatus Dormibacteraeota bacterium]|nr:lysophospholipid acyltransferase family protein [Candidatus Dormibacteraeota bacterium]
METTSPPPVTAPSWTQRGSIRGARAVLQTFLIFPLMGAFSPLTVIDRYRVKSIKGGAVFVSNHSSALDAVVMLQALPARFRFRAFVVAAADSIFKRKWEGALTQLLINTFPIPRAGGARPALDRLKQHLAHRWSVVIFPEGTLSRTGNIGTFKKGAAILAIDAGVPIVPAYIDGLYEVFPRFRRIPRRHPATIKFGDPLYPQPGEDYDSFIARTEQAVRTLAGPKGLLRDEPAPTGSASAEGSNYWY